MDEKGKHISKGESSKEKETNGDSSFEKEEKKKMTISAVAATAIDVALHIAGSK